MFDMWKITKLNLNSRMLCILVVLILQSCMTEIKPKNSTGGTGVAVNTSGYSGCVVATGLSISTIQVSYDFPSKASEISVYRNGINILTTRNKLSTSFIDINLSEGQTYNYECVATIDGIITVGTRDVDGTTLAVNAPTFSGIDSVAIISPTSVRVNWPATTGGAVAKEFKVYVTMNGNLNFDAAPRMILQSGIYTAVISGLADDMPYQFAVRACNTNSTCDSNTKALSLVMSDNGAATTIGATSVALYNGVARITAPWSESNGAVFKRRLYRSTTNNVATILSNVIKTINVPLTTNLANPTTIIEDDTILEGQTYYYIVRDEDPSGNFTLSSNIVTLVIGDLTAPIFSGLSSVALDSPAETSVLLGWTAISNQPGDPNGASNYLLYQSEANLPASPVNSCSAGTLVKTFSSSTYTQGTLASYKLTGLTPRKKYSFCLKAQDAALNISNTLSFREQLMPDLTAPQFDGLQNVSYDVATNKFTMVWNKSSSLDVKQYIAKVWKNTISPTAGEITTIMYNSATNDSGAIFGTTDFSFTGGDTVFMLVNACDDASPSYNTINNCTSFPNSTAIAKNLMDTTPPAGFLGVESTFALVQGAIQVNWLLPTDKSDYAGFKFYNIEETASGVFSKVFLGDTYCISNNCAANPKTSFSLSISRDYHTYNIFVSAVDLFGNETKATDLASTLTYSQITSIDTSVPNFTSSLTSTLLGGNINLSWNAATDNQYSKKNYATNNLIKYEIYRKAGLVGFDETTYVSGIPNYAGDTSIIRVATGLSSLTYSDPTISLVQGQTYHYTVCARDQSNNVKCDGFRSEILADNLPPVITTIRIDEVPNTSVWYLNMKVNDGVKEPGTVIVYTYAKYADDPNDFPDGTGALISSAKVGQGTASTPTEFIYYSDTLTNSAPYHYVNYFIKAVDAASNVTTTTYSHTIRRPTITASTINAVLNEDVPTALVLTTTGLPGSGLSASNLSYEIVTAPSHGTLTACMNLPGAVNGLDLSCSYLGNANYFGTDTFTYRVKDNLPMTSANIVTVNITVNNINDNPVATNVTKSIMITHVPQTAAFNDINVVATATDVDNTQSPGIDTLTVVTDTPVLSRPNFGTVSCSGQVCKVTSDTLGSNKYGTTSFNYSIQDDHGGTSSSGTYTVKIYTQYTWTGAIDNDFNKPGNWCGSLNASGNCVGAASIPGSGSNIVFSDLCVNCDVTIPANISLNSIATSETYNGVITLGTGINLTTSFYASFYGGTFDATNAGSMTANGSQNGTLFKVHKTAKFKAPATTLTIQDSYTTGNSFIEVGHSGDGYFQHNNGTVILTSALGLDKYIDAISMTFYNLKILNANANQKTVIGNATSTLSVINVENDLTVQNGTLTVNGNVGTKAVVRGNLITKFVSSSTQGKIDTLNTTLAGANSYINMQDSTKSAGSITVDLAGQAFSTAPNLVVRSLTIKDGTFNAPTGNFTVNRFIVTDISNGAIPIFNHNNGTTVYGDADASSDEYSSFATMITFKHLKFQRGYSQTVHLTGILRVLGDLTFQGYASAGSVSTYVSGEIQVEGNVVDNYLNGSAYGGGPTVKLVGGNNQIVSGANVSGDSFIENFSIAKTAGNVTFQGVLRISGAADFTHLTGTVDMGTSKIMFGGITVRTTALTGGGVEFYDVDFNQQWAHKIQLKDNLYIKNNLSFSHGHSDGISLTGGAIYLKKDLTLNNLATSGGATVSSDIYFVGDAIQKVTNNLGDNTRMIYSNFYVAKPSGSLVFQTNFNLNIHGKSLYIDSGTVDFNAKAVAVGLVRTQPGTVANSWSTFTYGAWTNNGGIQNN
jgi:hypothetical protein